MAFNAKNLHYDKQEPAFLRKLKGEFGNLDGRHNVQIARPKKDRLKTGDEDEDEPVIVDEQGETVEKADFERRAKGEHVVEQPSTTEDGVGSKAEEGEDAKQIDRQKVTEIGNAKKRKAVKVIAGEEADDRSKPSDSHQQQRIPSKDEADKATVAKRDATMPKKKAKKIKLSFDEPE
ncbi:hypothetical protein H2200_003516 [Cladophialophora chaetospira]|uniref:DUF4604 domain-containing protein n=1 Tax=Cladophialophora chaetospira TaxID=386627 RepID=A0AA38XHL6_9EURO|nr:hypothetical protein H2200_003516 [Cladophialophora chaetospira]